MRGIIHFAHGNGFPAPCYRQLLNGLEARYDCCFIEKIGHNPQFPVTENWPFLVDEVIDSVKQQAGQPVIAIGHSLGGVLSLLAAIKQPSLFKAVIMLDSPLLGRFKSSVVRWAKSLGVIERITPAHRTKSRREFWQTRDQLLAYLKTRDLFKTFTDDCLQDYIDYGLKKTGDGFQLCFDRHIEYMIYRTIPHGLSEYGDKIKVPTALIYGDKSTVVDRLDVNYMKKHYNIPGFKVKGGHMLPFERPNEVVEKIFMLLDAIII